MIFIAVHVVLSIIHPLPWCDECFKHWCAKCNQSGTCKWKNQRWVLPKHELALLSCKFWTQVSLDHICDKGTLSINILFASCYSLFIDETKLSNAAKEHLNDGMKVHIHPYDEIQSFLSNIYSDGKKAGKTWVRNAKGKIS